jgi:hypothetical protein
MGLSRKFARETAKRNYKKFCRAWTQEKSYQEYLLKNGQELPQNSPRLGRKPNFNRWLEITRTTAAQIAAKPEEVQKFATEQDLSWEEEGKEVKEADGQGA